MTRARSRATTKPTTTEKRKRMGRPPGPVPFVLPPGGKEVIENLPQPAVAVTKAGRVRPLELIAPYLGKRPDEWFAERIGRSIQTVAAMRLAAGMPSFGERCRARLPITNSDEEIERAINAFRNARKKYPHRGPTPGGF